MTKSEYVEKLRQRAADIVDEGYILIEEIADELESMDVVWVPREPTEEMVEQGKEAFIGTTKTLNDPSLCAQYAYHAMLAAAENTND